jgi:enoyl-[acyl-carrier protein] reductase/trans-2-enoyl-CoA reductase (NAD+)
MQAEVAMRQDWSGAKPKRALVIGCSTGYGLASRICATFGMRAETLGVFYEKPGTEQRCGTAGWYNAAAVRQLAQEQNLHAKDINGDAFSDEIKQRTVGLLREEFGPVDLLVYSLASPRRQHPRTGALHKSVLKPIGKAITSKTLDTDQVIIKDVTIDPASENDIADTVAVMGGEDWSMWIEALKEAGMLAKDCRTVAYTYIGEKITRPIYGDATIGEAKKDLDKTVIQINKSLSDLSCQAHIGVLKAVVTQSSAAIPIMPLYLSLLFKIMKEENKHEGCVDQIVRLMMQLYEIQPRMLDESKRMRCDGAELDPKIQRWVEMQWDQVNTENLMEHTDFRGFRKEFLQLFGFEVDNVDYAAEVSPLVHVEGVEE